MSESQPVSIGNEAELYQHDLEVAGKLFDTCMTVAIDSINPDLTGISYEELTAVVEELPDNKFPCWEELPADLKVEFHDGVCQLGIVDVAMAIYLHIVEHLKGNVERRPAHE